jgi:hypothetical protein
VGATPDGYIVYLKDTATTPRFGNRWFVLDPAHGKELLALAMTAYANGKIFYIGVETVTTGTTISTAYMMD